MLYQQLSHNPIASRAPVSNSNLHANLNTMLPLKSEFSPPVFQAPFFASLAHKNSAFHPLSSVGTSETLKYPWVLGSSPPTAGPVGHLMETGLTSPSALLYPALPSLQLNMTAWMQMRQQLAALLLYQQQESIKSHQEELEKSEIPHKLPELWSPNLSSLPQINSKVGNHLLPASIVSDHSSLKELKVNTQEPTEVKSVQTNFKEDLTFDETATNISTAASSHTNSITPEKKRRKSIFQDGVTVGYTIDAFFVSDGRSRRHSSNPNRRLSHSPPNYSSSNRQRYTCTECGKDYATSSNLSRHKQTHRSLDSKLAKKCPHCDKVYVSMPALSMHILTHDLKHTCDICGKAFSRPWLLQGHRRAHTGEKPYGCAHCGRAFADRSNLRAHMQTHSVSKNFDCKLCGKNFSLKSYLTKHQEAFCSVVEPPHSNCSSSENLPVSESG